MYDAIFKRILLLFRIRPPTQFDDPEKSGKQLFDLP